MNHFAETERLLQKAADTVVDSIERKFVARAAVHAQLAAVQAIAGADFEAEPVQEIRCGPLPLIKTRPALNDLL